MSQARSPQIGGRTADCTQALFPDVSHRHSVDALGGRTMQARLGLDRLRRIVVSANRQQRLVEDLLLLARLDQDLTAPQLVPVNVASLAHRVAVEIQGTYPGQRLDLDGRDRGSTGEPRTLVLELQADFQTTRACHETVMLLHYIGQWRPSLVPARLPMAHGSGQG
jgi:signal transduction histidine kinase